MSLWIVSAVLCGLWHTLLCTAQCNQLVALTDCVCPGQSVIYQCSVMDGVFTVYSGTAFQCRSGDITLRNNQFGSPTSIGACDSGQANITGRGLMEVNNCYTSQVNISLGEAVSQNTVSCSIDDGSVTLIDTAVLEPSTAFPPPFELSLSAASSNFLTFTWNPVSDSCPSLIYIILADNCGRCPNKTSTTSINCTDFSTSLSQYEQMTCMLSVQTVICDDTNAPVAGNITTMSYTLKVPGVPSLNITPYYNGSKQLIGFNATVILSDPHLVAISAFVDGSTKSFTLTDNCNMTTTILVSSESCEELVCNYYSRMTCSGISKATTVAVYASNILGNGRNSTVETIDNQNNFVDIMLDVEVNPKKVIILCVFQEQSQIGPKTCSIKLNGHPNLTESVVQTSNVVTITVNGLPEGSVTMYTITASNSSYRVIQQGFIRVPPTASVIVVVLTVSIIVLLILLSVLATGLLLSCWLVPICLFKRKGLIVLPKKDCKFDVIKKEMTLEDIGRSYRENYLQFLQEVYCKVRDGDVLPADVKIIVRLKYEKCLNCTREYYLAINTNEAAKIFVDEKRQINEENSEFQNSSVAVYAGGKPNITVPADTEILYCKTSPVAKDVLSDVHPTSAIEVPSGIEEVNFWFEELPEVKSEISLVKATHERFENLVGFNIRNSDQVGIYYTRQQGEPLNLEIRHVMVVSKDGCLFKDDEKIFGKIDMQGKELPSWVSSVYYEARDDLPLKAGSRVLIYDPNLKRVKNHVEIFVVQASKPLLNVVKDKIKCDPRLEHIYQCCEGVENVEDDCKFIAVRKNEGLFVGSKKSCAIAETYGWSHIFFQVQSNEHVPLGTMLAYCYE